VFDHVGFFFAFALPGGRLMRGLYERIPYMELPVLAPLSLILDCLATVNFRLEAERELSQA
jgi:hypothetical protein